MKRLSNTEAELKIFYCLKKACSAQKDVFRTLPNNCDETFGENSPKYTSQSEIFFDQKSSFLTIFVWLLLHGFHPVIYFVVNL